MLVVMTKLSVVKRAFSTTGAGSTGFPSTTKEY